MLLFVKSKKAFTAIELAVVIVIMVILAAAASVKSMNYDTMKLDAAARKVASDIRYAQSLVLMNYNNANFVPTTLDFSARALNFYRIYRGSGAGEVLMNTVDFRTGEYRGVDIDDAATSFTCGSPGNYLKFGEIAPSYLARPSCGGVPITFGQVVLTYKGKTRTITVAPETGLVQIQ